MAARRAVILESSDASASPAVFGLARGLGVCDLEAGVGDLDAALDGLRRPARPCWSSWPKLPPPNIDGPPRGLGVADREDAGVTLTDKVGVLGVLGVDGSNPNSGAVGTPSLGVVGVSSPN